MFLWNAIALYNLNHTQFIGFEKLLFDFIQVLEANNQNVCVFRLLF